METKKYYYKNREGIKEYYLNKSFWQHRKDGVSAMMRLKDDDDWIEYSLLSVKDVFDEIIVTLQNSTDKTEDIIRQLNFPNLTIYHYPFDSWCNTPGYDKHPPDSVYNRAYFYNWSLSKTTCKWVYKWDGDQVALVGLKNTIHNIIKKNDSDIVHIKGVDLFGAKLKYMCKEPFTVGEPLLFRVTKRTFYFPGNVCEEFSYPRWKGFLKKSRIVSIDNPLFLHMKWARPLDKAAKGSPENWQKIPHFSKIIEKKGQGDIYSGNYPKVLDKYFQKINLQE